MVELACGLTLALNPPHLKTSTHLTLNGIAIFVGFLILLLRKTAEPNHFLSLNPLYTPMNNPNNKKNKENPHKTYH